MYNLRVLSESALPHGFYILFAASVDHPTGGELLPILPSSPASSTSIISTFGRPVLVLLSSPPPPDDRVETVELAVHASSCLCPVVARSHLHCCPAHPPRPPTRQPVSCKCFLCLRYPYPGLPRRHEHRDTVHGRPCAVSVSVSPLDLSERPSQGVQLLRKSSRLLGPPALRPSHHRET